MRGSTARIVGGQPASGKVASSVTAGSAVVANADIGPPPPRKVQVRADAKAPALLVLGTESLVESLDPARNPTIDLVRGTKRQRKPGVWELRVYVGNDAATGWPLQVSKTFHGGVREADAALRELVDQQAPSRTDGVGATFGQFLDEWLGECERLELSPTTLRNYRSQIESTLRPALGKVSLARLNAKQLDDFYGTLKARGLSARTIHHYHATNPSAPTI
jgi:hypothetical protein